jgi:hypothetical protein
MRDFMLRLMEQYILILSRIDKPRGRSTGLTQARRLNVVWRLLRSFKARGIALECHDSHLAGGGEIMRSRALDFKGGEDADSALRQAAILTIALALDAA